MLGQGMTGSLTIEGDGLQYLAAGWILGRKSVQRPGYRRSRGNGDGPIVKFIRNVLTLSRK